MNNLVELNDLLLEEIHRLMDTDDERELSLLEVLTDACMEIEEFLGYGKSLAH